MKPLKFKKQSKDFVWNPKVNTWKPKDGGGLVQTPQSFPDEKESRQEAVVPRRVRTQPAPGAARAGDVAGSARPGSGHRTPLRQQRGTRAPQHLDRQHGAP